MARDEGLADAARAAAARLLESAHHAADEMARACGQANGSHESLLGVIRTVRDDLRDGSLSAVEEATQRLAGELMPTLAEALRMLHEESVPGLGAALDESLAALGLGHEAVEAMAVFAPPLEWAHGIVGMIANLLESMQLGL